MNPATLLLERLEGDGVDVSLDGDGVHFKATLGPVPPDLLDAIREHKAALVDLLRDAPDFTEDDRRGLVDWYATRTRADRLAIHRNGAALRASRGWPYWIADPAAMEAARDATNDLPTAHGGGNTNPMEK